MQEEIKDLNNKPLSIKQYLIVGSMLFALFFGAGNLIFPIHLGQLSGANWIPAALGFLISGVLLPLLSVLAISITRSKGVYDIAKPLGSGFAIVFLVLVHATLGPLFATPRTASVNFTVGIQSFIPQQYAQIGMFIFTAIFFITTFLLAYKTSSILDSLGKILNPLFLGLLFLSFLLAFIHPMGSASTQAVSASYQHASFFNGFLEGYNTMDALAGLAFGVAVVSAVNVLGKTNPKSNANATAKAGLISESLVGIIYIILIWIGATSLNLFKISNDNGGTTFNQFMSHYLGATGHALLATLMTLTCITTAVGLASAFAQDFHQHFSKLSYHQWLGLNCIVSFIIANAGLNLIITWSTPVLMFLYPFAITLILLSIFSPLFKRDKTVYMTTIIFTLIPAFFDMLVSLPPIISHLSFIQDLIKIEQHILPFANIKMDWVIPAIVGAIIGLIIYKFKNKH
ncbi:branched-chain amino acid transport system II carrier protein [Apilactobacillus timberlakei]|uniref:branched-chain amino acid transport system II carrier protein n=1 Tax=Apilactobacillus timberlakei TaxID=2008380 RepID=UPI00112A81EB|nr:branched-chain amino acid transport system II carrier protein [Apilactobacillus timberlakei]TPR18033.1 branched-chain amino acid transport system II carrier protein [Apilactobacillus timberlakei]TPR19835.1 branched-chain amino acid transport system II carrier protein [Apilactobacillus timberlakei]TPR21373.1 branched-chain amino acid transport system II carrier protein [Apilactobacillus timberlakei]TPR23397.1 branched-chain amino acid transport system II carrier protein [Apilactobacillus timb